MSNDVALFQAISHAPFHRETKANYHHIDRAGGGDRHAGSPGRHRVCRHSLRSADRRQRDLLQRCGYGACGTQVDASSQLLVAVPAAYWTTANPNDDPLCQGVSVQVSYNGTTITVPVEDKCLTCDPGHIDLSQPAFEELADTGLGNIPVTWEFLQS
jgi:hypothetical protein